MGSLLAERSLFQHVQNLISPKSTKANARLKRIHTIDIKQKEMMIAGDRLLDALNIERELGRTPPREGLEARLETWKKSRETVEQLSRSYALAVAKWRASIVETAVEENHQSAGSTWQG